MTRPANSQLKEAIPNDWNLVNLAGFILGKNGLFVTSCIALIIFQTIERRERDSQVITILTTNAKILSDLNASVRENDMRDTKSIEEMRPSVTRIESDLKEIKANLYRIKP